MTIQIHLDSAVRQELAGRGVDLSVGIFACHYVQLGKVSLIRLDEIDPAKVPAAWLKEVAQVSNGMVGGAYAGNRSHDSLDGGRAGRRGTPMLPQGRPDAPRPPGKDQRLQSANRGRTDHPGQKTPTTEPSSTAARTSSSSTPR